MANLPKADELIGSTVTQQQFKTKLKQLVENIDRSYATLAEANLDIANIGVGAKVDTDDSGRYYKATVGATSLTKSPYDPLTQARKEILPIHAKTNAYDSAVEQGYLATKLINFNGTKATDQNNLNVYIDNNDVFQVGGIVYLKFNFSISAWFTIRGYNADGTYEDVFPRTIVTNVDQAVTLSKTYTKFRTILESPVGATVQQVGGIFANNAIKLDSLKNVIIKSSDFEMRLENTKTTLTKGYLANNMLEFSGTKPTTSASLTVDKINNGLFKSGDVLYIKARYENYELWFNLRGYKADGTYDHIVARTALKSVDQKLTLSTDYVSFRMIFDYTTGVVINVSASISINDPIQTSEIRDLQSNQAVLLSSAKPFTGKKLFTVGDSITYNATDWNLTGGGYIHSILQNTGMSLVGSTGLSGNGMPLMLFARNMKTLEATIAQADILTILGGTNDYHSLSAYTIGSFADEAVPYSQLETVSPMSIYQAVKTIINCAQTIKPGIKIVFFTEPERGIYTNGGTNYPSTHTPPNASPNGLTMHGIAYAIKDCANKLGVAAFDTHAELWTFEQVNLACPDMLHPTKGISTKIGLLFGKHINSLVPIL
jgi:hypothetical protein